MQYPLFIAAILSALCLTACRGSRSVEITGELPGLDLEAAIENRRAIDLSEIADNIQIIALDNGRQDALVGEVQKIVESKNAFYVMDRIDAPIKIFDRAGKFVSTRGVIGRGPDEFLFVRDMDVDPDTDNIYLSVIIYGTQSVIGYDVSGRIFARYQTTTTGNKISYYNKKLFLWGSSRAISPKPSSEATVIKVFSSDLSHETDLLMPDSGSGRTMFVSTTDGLALSPTRSNLGEISIINISTPIISCNGISLLVKNGRDNTLFNYENGMLTPIYKFMLGKYTVPFEAYGMIQSFSTLGDSYTVRNVFDSEKYFFVDVYGYRESSSGVLIFDKHDLASGFSAVGPGKEPGLFLDGIAFTPMYVRDNRQVGYMQALDIVDARDAGTITNPQLKTLAATLKEDSNPVIVMLTLKR